MHPCDTLAHVSTHKSCRCTHPLISDATSRQHKTHLTYSLTTTHMYVQSLTLLHSHSKIFGCLMQHLTGCWQQMQHPHSTRPTQGFITTPRYTCHPHFICAHKTRGACLTRCNILTSYWQQTQHPDSIIARPTQSFHSLLHTYTHTITKFQSHKMWYNILAAFAH